MSGFSARTLFWTPRVLSIAFIALLSLFATDVFGERLGFWPTMQALAIHLIPSFVLAVVLVLAWHWEWIGAALFGAAGLIYIGWVVSKVGRVPPAAGMSWILTIAGPALLIAALFMANWWKHAELRGGVR